MLDDVGFLAPSHAATGDDRVTGHRFLRHTEQSGDGVARLLRLLRADPEIARRAAHQRNAGHRLHRRMREIGHFIALGDDLLGVLEPGPPLAPHIFRHDARRRQVARELGADHGIVDMVVWRRLPHRSEQLERTAGGPPAIRDDRQPVRQIDHALHAGQLQHRSAAIGEQLAAEHRRGDDRCAQHAGHFEIDRIERRSIDLLRQIEADHPLRRVARTRVGALDQYRRLGQPRGISRQFAVAKTLTGGADNDAVLGGHLRHLDVPAPRRRLDQHRARGRAGLGEARVELGHPGARAGKLREEARIVVFRVDRGELDADPAPLGVHRVADQHGISGRGSLPDLGYRRRQDDLVVRRQLQKMRRQHIRAGPALCGRREAEQICARNGRQCGRDETPSRGSEHAHAAFAAAPRASSSAARTRECVPQRQILVIEARSSSSLGCALAASIAAAAMIMPDWQ
ncbi:hypothetical protein D9M73_113340 [compost metagenome]